MGIMTRSAFFLKVGILEMQGSAQTFRFWGLYIVRTYLFKHDLALRNTPPYFCKKLKYIQVVPILTIGTTIDKYFRPIFHGFQMCLINRLRSATSTRVSNKCTQSARLYALAILWSKSVSIHSYSDTIQTVYTETYQPAQYLLLQSKFKFMYAPMSILSWLQSYIMHTILCDYHKYYLNLVAAVIFSKSTRKQLSASNHAKSHDTEQVPTLLDAKSRRTLWNRNVRLHKIASIQNWWDKWGKIVMKHSDDENPTCTY